MTFQPVQQAGRLDGYEAANQWLTLTEVRGRILEQTSVFKPVDSFLCRATQTRWPCHMH